MSLRAKLIALELLSGLLGWSWIICSVGTVVVILGAIFLDWSWWNVIYFFFGGGVSKWLAKGFMDNKQRVRFEAAMIEQGATPEEARNAWADAYLGEKT